MRIIPHNLHAECKVYLSHKDSANFFFLRMKILLVDTVILSNVLAEKNLNYISAHKYNLFRFQDSTIFFMFTVNGLIGNTKSFARLHT